MTSSSGWHKVLRLVWIAGGVVAVNEPGPNIQINVGLGGRTIHRLRINAYATLFEALREDGKPDP